MARPIRRLVMAKAVRDGLLGGSRFWTVVGTLGIAMRVLRKVAGDDPEVVYRERLGPGETLLISHERGAEVVRRRR